MAIQIGAKPDSGFDDPIGMLKDCHRRIERFLGILCLVADHAKDRSLSADERNAVEAALHYFRVGGERHTADEEESLFPRLRASSPESDNESFKEIDRLETDHREAARLHESIEKLYSTWTGRGELKPDDAAQLFFETERLRLLYAKHIQVEETIVFTRAARVLDGPTMQAIGSEFQLRRK